MNTQLTTVPRQEVMAGKAALRELKLLVQNRPDKLVINGRQYLYFSDWQIMGRFFNVTSYITETQPIMKDVPLGDTGLTGKEVIGFWARAVARDIETGKEISAAEAECLFEEKNWGSKPRFQVLSMAQTRACAKALRNCLQWVVRLPDSDFADQAAEEVEHNGKQGSF